MQTNARFWLAVGMLLLAGGLVADAQILSDAPNVPKTDTFEPPANPAPHHGDLLTIAKGPRSGYGAGDLPGFDGADLVIRDREAWGAFWRAHAAEDSPPPRVDFAHRVVIAVIQGLQPSSGGPNIAILGVHSEGPFASIRVFDDEHPGPLPALSNPFHIVSVPKRAVPPRKSVAFRHVRPRPETGVIVGRVFADRPDGEPVPLGGAHVLLARDGEEPRRAMTGRDGSYFFVNVTPGPAMLRAGHPHFEPAEQPIEVPPNGLTHHDFVLTPHAPEVGAVVGAVLAARGDGEPVPLPGALLVLIRGDVEVQRQHTNDRGRFAFEHVRAGAYVLVALHPGFFPQEFAFEIEAEQVVEHVFVLEPRPGDELGAFVGRVIGFHGDREVPIAGALVTLSAPDGVVRETHTGERGFFAMHEVHPGEYLAAAHAEGWLPAEAPVEIVPGEPTHHRFVLEQP